MFIPQLFNTQFSNWLQKFEFTNSFVKKEM